MVSVSDVPWEDVRTAFGTRGDPAGCWCQYFKMPNAAWETATRDECAGMLRQQIEANEPAPGVIAYDGDEPVGWCAVEPRPKYSRLQRLKVLKGSDEDPTDTSVWAVTCFVVRVGHRRKGVASALLDGAVHHAREHGARVIEGYPVDTGERVKASSAELYHGTLSLFERAGFEIASRPTDARAVVRLEM